MSKLIKVEKETTTEWIRPEGPWPTDLKHPIVLINGGFDLLHMGHMKIIRQAKARAGTLICALDSDRQINHFKGPGRPVLSWQIRASTIAYFDVDYIVEIDTKQDMDTLIQSVKFDFRVQGEDHASHESRYTIPKLFVHRGSKAISTTDIINKCKECR